MKITFSKKQWTNIGKKAGWIKKLASTPYYTHGLKFDVALYGKHYNQTLTSPEEFPDVEVENVQITEPDELLAYLLDDPNFKTVLIQAASSATTNLVTLNYEGLNLVLLIPNPITNLNEITPEKITITNETTFLNSLFVQNIINKNEGDMYQTAEENEVGTDTLAEDAYDAKRTEDKTNFPPNMKFPND